MEHTYFYSIIINQSLKKIRQHVQTLLYGNWPLKVKQLPHIHLSLQDSNQMVRTAQFPALATRHRFDVRSQCGAMPPICLQTYLQVEIMTRSFSPQLFLSVTYYPPVLVRSRQSEKWQVTGWQDWPLPFIDHISVSMNKIKCNMQICLTCAFTISYQIKT
jgi:hypothetical protein